ncbi:MAG: putative permease, partial [Bacteroidetes bacterium]|nr:putative permease [Bacteroidota bacterium]
MDKTKKTKLILSLSAGLPALVLLYYFLQPLVNYFTYNLLGLNPESHLGTSVNFFFYDTIKILILLFVISSLMGVINAYFPIERL